MARRSAELALILKLVDEVTATNSRIRKDLLETGKAAGGLRGTVEGLGKVGFGIMAGAATVGAAARTAGAASAAAACSTPAAPIAAR